MRIRRVTIWDYMHEADNAAPTKYWTAVDGDWDIVTRALRANHDGGTTIGTCYWTDSTAATVQDERLLWDIDMDIQQTSAGWWAAIIIQADAQAGRYLGNSIVIYIDATDIKVYTSAANVLTERQSETSAHSSGNTYRLEVDFNPVTGAIVINQDANLANARPEATTEVLSGVVPGAPISGNTELGLACEDCIVDFRWFQVHRPDFDQIAEGSVAISHYISKSIDFARFATGIDDDKDITQEFSKGDYFEILTEDGTLLYREFFGRLEKTEWDTAHGVLRCDGRGLLQQLSQRHVDGATGLVSQGAMLIDVFDTFSDDLPSIDVKAGGDNYNNTVVARPAWLRAGALARQLGYGIWQGEDRTIQATDTFPASGLTIDSDNDVVLDARDTEDLYDLCNEVHVYYGGAAEVDASDAASQATYGQRGGSMNPTGVVLDLHTTVKGQAGDEAQFWIDNYKDPVEAVMVQVADFHELNVGDTVTLNIDHLGLAGSNSLVAEKHYRDGEPFFSFMCIIYGGAAPVLRWNRDPTDSMQDSKRMAQENTSWNAG
jgi:hypothetical protein